MTGTMVECKDARSAILHGVPYPARVVNHKPTFEIGATMKCDHRNQYFDRETCPEPCGRMHYFCDDCGECADECEWDREFTAYEGQSVIDATEPCEDCGGLPGECTSEADFVAYEGSSVIDALVSKGWEKISE